MNFISEIKEEENFLKDILLRFRRRDFSGDTGQAIKNSSYQLAQNLIFKFGSLFFTIIIARLLLPERMGLYNLALSTIILIASFSDLGLGQALITFIPKQLESGNLKKAKAYWSKLSNWKIKLLAINTLLIIPVAYIASGYIYTNKPIFFAILAGIIYLPATSMVGYVEQLYKAKNNFKTPLIKEVVFQILRLTIIPLVIITTINWGISNQRVVFATIISLSFLYIVALVYLFLRIRKKVSFLQEKSSLITKEESLELKNFLIPLSATAMAGMFFGYIDTIMLGHYVSTEYIAYYGAAFSLIGGVTTIISFMSVSIMPIFARRTGTSLEKIFKKTTSITAIISILAGLSTYLVSNKIIEVVYGLEYIQAAGILKVFSILVVLLPITAVYISYFTSQRRTSNLAWMILLSSILNIIFNFVGIIYGLRFGEMGAVYGACVATILSRGVYLIGLKHKK